MKLARYSANGKTSIGLVQDDRIYDIPSVLPALPQDITGILAAGASALAAIREALPGTQVGVPLAQVRLEAPIPRPSKYLAIGMNYNDHAEECRQAGIPIPKAQVWFNKQVSCITGPFDDIHRPFVSDKMDYEAELGVVIGKRCRHVSVDKALDMVGGYFVANDVTARDWQHATPTWTLGKSFDTHGPIGPWIVTADEVADPQNLNMRLYVNGQLRQQQTTGDMIYKIAEQIAHLSTVMTLEPGDLIASGTCAGIGIALKPPCFLQAGDVVRVEIDGIGHLENKVIDEPRVA